jgi:hypothetical protein
MSGIRGKRYIDENGNEVLTGGLKAAATNKKRYGNGFYSNIGARGGKISKKGGFYANPELAKKAGAIGGRISKRHANYNSQWEQKKDEALTLYTQGKSFAEISRTIGIPYATTLNRLKREINENS